MKIEMSIFNLTRVFILYTWPKGILQQPKPPQIGIAVSTNIISNQLWLVEKTQETKNVDQFPHHHVFLTG
jgi:hypothetical protein